jgi:hypothetical protein
VGVVVYSVGVPVGCVEGIKARVPVHLRLFSSAGSAAARAAQPACG